MANIGQAIDRVDGRLKVTGRARYAAEFTVPDVVHAVLVQSTIGAGAITGFDLDGSRRRCRACSRSSRRTMRRSCIPRAARSRLFARRCCRTRDIHYNGQHVAVVVAETLEQARRGGALVRVQYRRDEPITSMDAVLGQAYRAEEFPQRRAVARFAARRSRRGFRRCGGQGRCDLHHADRASQSDGTARHDRALGRRSADGLDRDAGHLRRTADAGRRCSASTRPMCT